MRRSASRWRSGRLTRGGVVLLALAGAALALPFADLEIADHLSWSALGRMAAGLLQPDFSAVEDIGSALANTVAFAVAGVAAGGTAGLLLAPFHHLRSVRALCVALRSVHELFWALLLLQVTGIGPLTGVLAIALPYTGIFAKVAAEAVEEADPRPAEVLPTGVDAASRFLWARAPLVVPSLWAYALYRVECGIRSSAVLGFVGLPTLGYQLDTFLRQGAYGAAGAVILCLVALVATMRLWMRPIVAPIWLAASLALLAWLPHPPMGAGALWRFLTVDVVPAPLQAGEGAPELAAWAWMLLRSQVLPGLAATIVAAQLALVLTGLMAFAGFGLIVPRVAGRVGRHLGHLVLVVMRSLPEVMLAYLFLQALGPSMLPAVLALALHNGAIIAHLLGRDAEAACARLRPDAPRGLTLWAWELAPRLFGRFVALCLYRWEVILRETAVMGLLGVATLGFYVGSAVAELRMDRAVFLLVAMGGLTAVVDALSRALRRGLGERAAVSMQAPPSLAETWVARS